MVLLEIIGALVVVSFLGVGLMRVLKTVRFVDPQSPIVNPEDDDK